MWRNEDAAVLLGRRKAKDVVILVDGSALLTHSGVMAVGETHGQKELLHARGAPPG